MAKKTTKTLEDFGEKIAGARKDMAIKRGPKPSDGEVDTRPGWLRRFKVTQVPNVEPTVMQRYYGQSNEAGKFIIEDTRTKDWRGNHKRATRQVFETQAEAERAVPLLAVSQKHFVRSNYARTPEGKVDPNSSTYEIWRKVSDKKQVKAASQQFASREEAMAYMAQNAAKLMTEGKGFGEEIRPRPERVYRKGPETRAGEVNPKKFLNEFGFRGVQFGNWQDERQKVVDHAYDAMRDLAEVTGFSPEVVGNRLGLAFGARGHGGKNAAAAHYEPVAKAINLTKLSGAGTLAHEWWHATDHLLGNMHKPEAASKPIRKGYEPDFYASHMVTSKGSLDPRVVEAYKEVMDALYHKNEERAIDVSMLERRAEQSRKNLESHIKNLRDSLTRELSYKKRGGAPATEAQLQRFDELAGQLVRGDAEPLKHQWNDANGPSWRNSAGRWTNSTLEALNALHKEVRGASGFSSENSGPLNYVGGSFNAMKGVMGQIAEAKAKPTEIIKKSTDYYQAAKSLDEARSDSYWTTKHEMSARAFEAYVYDKLKEAGRQSDYLVYGVQNNQYAHVGDNVHPYPGGEERVRINAAFDKLMAAMRESGTVKPAETVGLRGWSDKARAASLEARQEKAQSKAPVEVAKSVTETPKPSKAVTRKAKTVTKTAEAANPAIGNNGGPSDSALKAAAKLEAVAKRTIERAEKVAGANRKMNTPRRIRMGNGVVDAAHQDIADAKTALKIAEALRNGEAGALSNVKSLADIRELRRLARAAEHATDRREGRSYKPGGYGLKPEDVSNLGAAKGYVRLEPRDLQEFKDALAGKKGLATDFRTLERFSQAATSGGRTDFSTSDPAVFKAMRNVANAIKKADTLKVKYAHETKHIKYKAGRFLEEVRDFDRAARLAGGAAAEGRQEALKAFLDVRAGKTGIDPIKAAEQNLVGMKLPGFFPTPKPLAERMADLADIRAGQRVLEPSAGTGRLADAAKAKGATVDTVETASTLRDVLAKKGHNLIADDFTAMEAKPQYDRILMNPPFEKGQDIAHVQRAYEMLKPGGKMVAIMGEGAFYRGDKQATEFRTWLEGKGGTNEKLPEGTFKESNTGTNTRLVTITKPAASGEHHVWDDAARAASAEVRAAKAPEKASSAFERAMATSADRAAAPTKSTLAKADDDMFGGPSVKDELAAKARQMEAKGRVGDPMNDGLFGSGMQQTDLVDMAKTAPREPSIEGLKAQMAEVFKPGPKAGHVPGLGNPQEKYWSYQTGTHTPTVADLPEGAIAKGTTDKEFESLSPGMRREIARTAARENVKAGKLDRPTFMMEAQVKPHPEGGHMVKGPGMSDWIRTPGTGSTIDAKAMAWSNVANKVGKLGVAAMIAAPVTAAMVAYDSTKRTASAAGKDDTAATVSAGRAALVAGGSAAAIGYAASKAIEMGAHAVSAVGPTAAKITGRVVPGLGVGLAALGAYQGYQRHGVTGAILGTVGADALLDIPKAPVVGGGKGSRFAGFAKANTTFHAMQATKAPKGGPKGWANPTVQAAAQAAKGRTFQGFKR